MKTIKGKFHPTFLVIRLFLCFILAITANAGLVKPVQAAGTYTHSWFVEQAIQRLQTYGGYSALIGILNSYPGIVNYGAMFPDTTYGNIDNNYAENLHDTGDVNENYRKYLQFLTDHGYSKTDSNLQTGYYKEFLDDPDYTAVIPPFRGSLMSQILQNFLNSPRTTEDEKKIAFVFGLIAHQEADIAWHWKDPNWLGLEDYAYANGYTQCNFDWPFGSFNHPEICFDVVLRYSDAAHLNPIDTSYLSTIKSTVLTSSDAAGISRPLCRGRQTDSLFWICENLTDDPFDDGQEQIDWLWLIISRNDFYSSYWHDFVQNYVVGGLGYGSALVAGAWMKAWDMMSYTGPYYAKPSASGEGNCQSWENACPLRHALGLSMPGKEVWVAAGVHTPTVYSTDLDATFKISYMDVYGGFAGVETARYQRDPAAHLTILSGDIENNDIDADGDRILENPSGISGNNSYHVVTGGATGSTLDGFVITAGKATFGGTCNGYDCQCLEDECGGGMLNQDAGTLITNVTFSGNKAKVGGGMFIGSSDSSKPTPTITSVTFIGNTANVGGGMFIKDSLADISNVTFSENSADLHGGGIFIDSPFNVISHATFRGNSAGGRGGGVYAFPASTTPPVQIRNSIFWSNTATAGAHVSTLSVAGPDFIYLGFNVVQGGCPILYSTCGNVYDGDPMLGTLGDNGGSTPTIPLLAGSSAIDAAADDYCLASIGMSGAGGLDQRGVTRPMGDCDIGAYEADDSAPSPISFARQDPATSPTNADQLVFRATFNENVHNVDPVDFIVSGTTGIITGITALSGSVYDVTVAGGDLPDLDGIVGLDLAAGQDIADIGENALPDGEPAIDETYEVSNAALSLISFTRQSPATSLTNADVLVFRATFSAVAKYVDRTAFSVTGTTASVTLVTAINTRTYDITVSGGDLAILNGTVGLDLSPRSEISDLNGDFMPLVEPAVDETYEVDNIAPVATSILRQDPLNSPTNAPSVTFRATFGEAVQNVHLADFGLSFTGTAMGSINAIDPISASVYDVVITGVGGDGIVDLNIVSSNDIADLAGNLLGKSPSIGSEQTYEVDNLIPDVVSILRQVPLNSPTNAPSVTFRVTFGEAVQNIHLADFDLTLTGTVSGNINVVDPISASIYDVVVTGVGGNGIVNLDIISGNDIADLADNPLGANPTIGTEQTYAVDNLAPTVISILRHIPLNSPTNEQSVTFRVTFGEAVQNVHLADFGLTITGTAIGGINAVNMNTAGSYDVVVTGVGGDGIVDLNIVSSNDITDLADNPLGANPTIGTEQTYEVDNLSPTVTFILRQDPLNSPTNAPSVTFRVTFGEGAQQIELADFDLTVTDTAMGSINAIDPISASIYDVVITGVGGNGILDLSITSSNDITDLAGNPLGANPTIGTEQTYEIDSTYPIVLYSENTIPAHNSALFKGPTQIVIEFSEDVVHDGSVEAANSQSNYLLVEDGKNHRFDTLNCSGGRVADDKQIIINSVNYSNNNGTGPFVATLNVNYGISLPEGTYRLYICGTTSIHDPAGNHLNGGESDAHLNFTVIMALPDTGFAPNRVTLLPSQPAEKTYANLGDLWLDIPKLGVQIPIVGVPLSSDGSWDVSWLGKDAGWLNGSAFPTYSGNSVLTGHVYDSEGNPGPFARLNLLSYGDMVIVHAWGTTYVYEVREVLQVKPWSTSAILKHQERSWITLVTCLGYDASTDTYAYRVLVRTVLTEVK